MNKLILASFSANLLASWKQGLDGFAITSLIKDKSLTNRLESIRDEIVKINPQILLLDIELLGDHGSLGIATLRRMCAETKVIILTGDITEQVEWELVKSGMRGCCKRNASAKLIRQVVDEVRIGGLWIRRTLTSRLIDELGKASLKVKTYRATLGLLNKLTQRECDIAVRVGNGECNKNIALACGITERTVKAHLTEIFQKLGVTDRLNLALVLAADNRIACANSENEIVGGSRSSDNNSIVRKEYRTVQLVAG